MAGGKVNASPLRNQALPRRGGIRFPLKNLCKSKEPDGLALEMPLMVREEMNSTPKVILC